MTRLYSQKSLAALKVGFTNCINKLMTSMSANASYKNDLLLKVDELLSSHCDTITLQNVADAVELSPAYFSILFKEQAGKNYKDYILNYKMKVAQSMLCHANVKITDVSEKLGYQDANYFSKVFKRVVGLTPSEYRQKLSNK